MASLAFFSFAFLKATARAASERGVDSTTASLDFGVFLSYTEVLKE